MVKFFKINNNSIKWALVPVALFAALSGLCLFNSIRLGNDEPKLILVFFGYPTSWFFLSIFNPLLEWFGPSGSLPRRIFEWVILISGGGAQTFLIAFFVISYFVRKKIP